MTTQKTETEKCVEQVTKRITTTKTTGQHTPGKPKIEMCECGFPQSYPIPHEHSKEREAYERAKRPAQGQQTEHTPTPYEYPIDCGCIFSEDREIALVHGEDRAANAAFIVRACNSHDALVEACKQALYAIPTTHGAFQTVRKAITSATKE